MPSSSSKSASKSASKSSSKSSSNSGKLKPAEIAAQAKKTFVPYITANYSSVWPLKSYLCYTDAMVAPPPMVNLKCRFAFYERDPVDLALDWTDPDKNDDVPVIMPANETRPGGDWETGTMMPEECLCRRSNLHATLLTPAPNSVARCNYPIPSRAGIYSPKVVIFREGPDSYAHFQRYRALPIISVCPVKRPRLDPSGRYAFEQEREQMREKIHSALRIAVWYKYNRLCIGNFGLGHGFSNPTEEVAMLWRDAFLKNPEFVGHFQDIVFAFAAPDAPTSRNSSTSSKAAPTLNPFSEPSSSASSSSSNTGIAHDLAVFRHVFKPANIHNAFKQSSSSRH
ncbi:hypothetical protein K3495_g3228 [Podosphaera aphanis]|nr:hypothetical protein K3495_g3228 [Podosphaera aphanis]